MVLERIYREFQSAYIRADEKKLGVTISAGIASIQLDMERADQLVMQADRALYIAKNSGRNRTVVFNNNEDDK